MHNTPHTVSDVMTRTVLALKTGATFKDVVKAMREWKVSALPVVDDGHRVVGVVSEADLLLKEEFRDGDPDGYARPRRPEDLAKAGARTAEELMTAPAVTVRSGASLAQGARIMARHRVKRLPVVDGDGVLKGIVSRGDLLGVFLRDDADLAREVRRAVVERLVPETPGAIRVEVRDGIVKLTGRFRETGLAPVAAHLARAVEGVVDVDCALSGPRRHLGLDPELPDGTGAVTSPGTPPG
ncbi:CBS domain-containing protein [Streptomyces sp. ActVer]|uniref:CBS domain-containing protein n=1 Tax=Streptomyces sp. ActVer TaxID=3014558 RepID=UPI0022B411B8|nr:CBS domain-containing protein [Streptomyces sp. ActVer]MCZ4514014.1 CBS domain-containing protein [Streptomyces sp. ActVer]